MSDPLKTLYESLSRRLDGANTLWDDRVFPDFIPGREDRPSVVFNQVVGGETNNSRRDQPEYLLDIKIITSNQDGQQNAAAGAMSGAGFLSDLIKDQGSQGVDGNGDPTERAITGDDEWVITTITQQNRIHFVDDWTKIGVANYHSGHEYRIMMEELS